MSTRVRADLVFLRQRRLQDASAVAAREHREQRELAARVSALRGGHSSVPLRPAPLLRTLCCSGQSRASSPCR